MNRRSFLLGCMCASFAGISSYYGIKYKQNMDKDAESKVALDYIEVHLADYCNLNCKYCSHFASIADKHLYDKEQFRNDIERLSVLTEGRIATIRLMGGEPLLNPNINEYIEITRKNFENSKIIIVTNCLLLNKKDETFWEILHKNNIEINPSVYKVNIDWEQLKEKAKKHKVSFVWYDEKPHENDYFYNIGLDLKGEQKDLQKCKKCFTGGCYNLVNGKLYVCPVAAYIKYFNKKFNQNIQVADTDYIDIYKIKDVKEIIKWTKQPVKFCRYCGEKILMPWERSDVHETDEWVC